MVVGARDRDGLKRSEPLAFLPYPPYPIPTIHTHIYPPTSTSKSKPKLIPNLTNQTPSLTSRYLNPHPPHPHQQTLPTSYLVPSPSPSSLPPLPYPNPPLYPTLHYLPHQLTNSSPTYRSGARTPGDYRDVCKENMALMELYHVWAGACIASR